MCFSGVLKTKFNCAWYLLNEINHIEKFRIAEKQYQNPGYMGDTYKRTSSKIVYTYFLESGCLMYGYKKYLKTSPKLGQKSCHQFFTQFSCTVLFLFSFMKSPIIFKWDCLVLCKSQCSAFFINCFLFFISPRLDHFSRSLFNISFFCSLWSLISL